MDLARLRSNITLVSVLTALSAVSILSTPVAATPPSSELNGVAKIAPAAEVDEPVAVGPGEAETIVAPSAIEIEDANASIESDEPSGPLGDAERSAPEASLPAVIDAGPLAPEVVAESDPDAVIEEASRNAAAEVLSTAGEIASFDRTPIFGRSGEASSGGEAGTPATSTTAAGNTTSWWNAPELRVFGLLAVLVLAAVFMKRHGGRGIGLAGGPRPSGVVSVLGRFPFGRSASLVLLECGPKVLLLHQHAGKGGEVTTLAEFSDLDEVADLRSRLSATERDAKGGFGRELEQTLGLYDRRGRPRGFGGEDGLPVQGPIETVDLTRRRPRRGVRGN